MKLMLDRLNSSSVFLFLAILTGFVIGYIHHTWSYPLNFHGDSSAMQILAQAMLDEKSFIPKDFSNGNQLILFRSSPFIAAALAMGATGYDAFILGSSVSIAFWFAVLYLSLFRFTGDKIGALILSTVFFIPMGIWEQDFMLGQQSHLSNAVMSICIGVFTWLYFSTGKIYSAILAAFFIFLMVVEAPIRALLVFLPLFILVFVLFNDRRGLKFIALLSSVLVVGFLLNRGLILINPPEVDHFQIAHFRGTDEIFRNLVKIVLEMIANISSTNMLASKKISLIGMVLLASGLTYLILLIGFFLYESRLLVSRFTLFFTRNQASDVRPDHHFLPFLAVFGLVSGALVIATLHPDSARHSNWAYSILKLSLILSVYKYLQVLLKGKLKAGFVIISLFLIASFWSTTLFQHGSSLRQKISSRLNPDIAHDIARISQKYGIYSIYGEDFWRMMPLNTMIPGIAAGTLLIEGIGKIVPYHWLSRKSWFDYQKKVLYYLKDGRVDNEIRVRLSESGGKRLLHSDDGTIWIGPPVWNFGGQKIASSVGKSFKWAACDLPTKIGVKTGDCEMQKNDLSLSGHLTYGPYVKLSTGRYTFEIAYSSSKSSKEIVGRWDVHLSLPESGEIIDRGEIYGSDNELKHITKSFRINPKRNMEMVEIRTLAHSNVPLKIISLQITQNE